MAPTLHARLLGGALALRLLLLGAGELQDRWLRVKYTDVDYDVYSDAAREVATGRSPFERTTYRYTPALYAPACGLLAASYSTGADYRACKQRVPAAAQCVPARGERQSALRGE